MHRSARWLVVAVILALGCGRSEQSSTSEQSGHAESATGARNVAVPKTTTDKALVQVVIYGLAAFQLQHDSAGKLTDLSVHLPKVSSPPHDLILQRGVMQGKMQWEDVTEDDNHDSLDVGGKSIKVDMMGDLGEVKGATIGDYPARSTDAADVGWMLQATEIDTPTSFNPAGASAHVNFQNGILETCALAFPPKRWGNPRNEVCKIRVKNDKNVERSSSEIMVIRGWVPKSAASVKVELDDGAQTQTVTVPATGGDPVTWQGVTYDTVIDVAIGNRYRNPGRDMSSTHANMLKQALFPGASGSWDMDSRDCPPQQNCSCKPDLQPACWTAYIGVLFENTPSGYDRPICPLVGWSQ
jgi:hypothetical protein